MSNPRDLHDPRDQAGPGGSRTPQTGPAPYKNPRRRTFAGHTMRALGWTIGGLLLLLVVAVAGFAWYTTTANFQQRVKKQIVDVLETATGGRVELRQFAFNLRHLGIEADGLVIHGTEAPTEAPYIAVDRIEVRLEILSFFSHTAGAGLASHIGLDLLRVEHPRIHLIVDKDGKTNQPVPRHPRISKTPLSDTLLDLKAHQVELSQGVALINDRAIPFDVAANDLEAEIRYLRRTDRYGATVDLNDLTTKMAANPEVQSKLHLSAELGRDLVQVTKLDYTTGTRTHLVASASLTHFNNPQWQAALDGSAELKQISLLTGAYGLNAGTLDLDLRGHNCMVSPAVAQKRPPFWRRAHPTPQSGDKPSVKQLPPDPDCVAGYLLAGEMKVHSAAYADPSVRLHDINGSGHLRITPTDLLFTALTGYLPGGGSAEGDLRITNWLGEVPSNTASTSPTTVAAVTTANKSAKVAGVAPPVTGSLAIDRVQPSRAYLTAITKGIPLRTIMDVTAPKDYGDLGFDTAVSGPVTVEWGGPAENIADTVQVEGDLTFAPTGVVRRGALSNVPVTGHTRAHYDGKTEVVRIETVELASLRSTLTASGVLGVNVGDPLTALHADLTVHDLSEYDQLLQTLGLKANGKKGTAAIPVVLHGSVEFEGVASGPIADLDLKGRLRGADVEVKLGTAFDAQVDSVLADGEFSPYSGLVVANSTIKRGTAVLNVGGSFKPRKDVSRGHAADYQWDGGMLVDAKVQLANAQLADVLQIAGQQQKYPVTGTLNLNAHASGTLKTLGGSGSLSLANGVAYGEPYQSVKLNLAVQGRDFEATGVQLQLHGMQIAGNGGYDLASKHLHAHVQGNDLVLSKFEAVQRAKQPIDGTLTLLADANGTLEQPGLTAKLTLANVTADAQPIGELAANLHSQGSLLYLDLHSTLVGAKVDATAQTQLTGEYDTQAKLTLAGLDIGKPIALFSPGSIDAASAIDGVVTIAGPLKTLTKLHGDAQFDHVNLKLQGVELSAAEPLHASLADGVATLQQFHVTGVNTDLHASGTAQVFGVTDPKGGKLNLHATGNVSPAIAHMLDPEVLASGKITFAVAAAGPIRQPALTGDVHIEHVNAAIDGVANGLTDMNGTLIFNEDRLEVQSLTATTGGGKLSINGFLTYRNGLYANLTAAGDTVRVRLYGLSATANTNLQLQGSPQNLRLSGTVLLTRFGVGADVDFAAFSGASGVSTAPDPSSFLNTVRLDVQVTSSPQLDFQNSYAKLAGTVALNLRGTLAAPTILGRIQITDGSATFAGTKYELQRGDIYFSNPVRIDPVIDLDASARVENYDITVGLHGTASNIKPTYRSEPPLSEADVFNLLALGRTQEEAQLYQEQQAQSGTDPTTNALLGGALNATVSNRVQKLFGVGSVKIDPAFIGTLGNASARITVEQQVSQQITVTYATNVNETAEQLIQVQYQLTPSVSIVASRDESGVFSLVYKIRQRYH
jgi:translocation and assembly module TamB